MEPDFYKTILEQIGKRHSLGHKSGGSGHMGFVGTEINEIQSVQLENGDYEVTYEYMVYVVTEFTVYGENDPMSDVYKYRMLVRDGRVIEDTFIQQLNEIEFEMVTGLEPDHDDMFWYDRLDKAKDYPKEQQQKAIEHFQSKMVFPEYLLTPEETFAPEPFPKSKWENYLKCLEPWAYVEEVQQFYCSFLADLNWPGYQFARITLLKMLSSALPSIETEIKKSVNDPDVVERLQQLSSDIRTFENELTNNIKRIISQEHKKKHPQFPERQVTVVEINPVRTSEEQFAYEVQFELIDTDKTQQEPFGGIWTFDYHQDTKDLTIRSKQNQ